MATQKNKLEEVIHLYLGCEVQVRGDIEKLIGVESDGAVITFSGRYGRRIWGAKEVKPLLRQLSDITEEEKEFIVRCITYNHVKFSSTESALGCWDNEEYGKKIQHMRFYADELQYLLSKGFDLFSLIETGQAIDKNTLKETKN